MSISIVGTATAGRRRFARRCARGFTLIELLVVIAIIALLVGILMPTLQKAKELAKDLVCMTNLRVVGFGAIMYAQDFNEQLPATTKFRGPEYSWLDWSYRVGRMSDANATLPACFVYFDIDGPIPRETYVRICTSGYVDYNHDDIPSDRWIPVEGQQWHKNSSTEGAFKCPSYWTHVERKATGQPTPRQFSMNALLSTYIRAPRPGEPEDSHECARLDEIGKSTAMIGDCSLKPAGGDFPKRLWEPRGKGPNGEQIFTEETMARDSPWMWQIDFPHGRSFNIDYYGHAGDAVNLYFTDGHVEAKTKISAEYFNVR